MPHELRHRQTDEIYIVGDLAGMDMDTWEIVSEVDRLPANEAERRNGRKMEADAEAEARRQARHARGNWDQNEMIDAIEALGRRVAALEAQLAELTK